VHSADAVLACNGRELGFGIEWQIDDLILDVATLQVLAIVVHCGQQLAGMDGAIHLLTAERLPHQHTGIATSSQLQDGVNAARGATILAEQLKVAAIGLRYEHLGAHICGLASLLDLDGLRQYLILLSRAQKERCALE